MYTSDEIHQDVPDVLPAVRAALRERIAATSLRQVARELGMSATGLSAVAFRGADPYFKTRRKLAVWYRTAVVGDESAEKDRRLAVETLTAEITSAEMRRRLQAVLWEIAAVPPELVLAKIEAALRGDEEAER